ncbi:MerR family DNA-binding transcriptional regulator, partial [Streptomyces nojiriensis]|uniref:MerR family DNA-binding transcriptional regulator n=1 Tax=Streptomyces nojiriensis TaxID=66374 RepID=UPI0035DFFBCC
MPSTLSLNLRWKLFRSILGFVSQNLQSGRRLRPVDLARGHGLSTQAIRNYEEAGILPAADRTSQGYR